MKTQSRIILRATICALALFSLLSYPLTVSAQTQTPLPTDMRGFRLSLAKLSVAEQKNAFAGMSPELKCAVWKDRIAEALERPLKEKQRNVLLRIQARIRPEIYLADNNAEKTQFSNFVKNLEKEANEAFANEDARLLVQILTQLTDKIPSAGAIQSTPAAPSPDCDCVQGGGWDDKCPIGFTCQAADCTRNGCGFFWWRNCNGMCKWNTSTASAPATSSLTTRDGLQIVTFDTLQGRVIVNLPDDMRAGDTISGTVRAEPKGDTKEEKAKNLALLGDYFYVNPGSNFAQEKLVHVDTAPQPFTVTVPNAGSTFDGRYFGVDLKDTKGQVMGTATVPLEIISLSLQSVAPIQFPTLAQQGKPVEITSGNRSLDGKSATTNCTVAGQPVVILAESPGKVVIESPTNVTGPVEITLKEGNQETKGTIRNVEVNLNGKTNLTRDEQTPLTFQAGGLQGITEPVQFTLAFTTGVIRAEGGPYQPLVIQPSQVGADGRYTTTRVVTGVQTGVWGATATLVTHKFDVCLQDDTAPARRILWNTFNGEYIFTNPFPPKPSGQPPQTGSTTPTSLTGTGKITIKGCIFTLEHNVPYRRVMSRIDQCTNTGSASVQAVSPKIKFTIIDRNTTNNTCAVQ